MVFDLGSSKSLSKVRDLIRQMRHMRVPHTMIILVGNKADLFERKEVLIMKSWNLLKNQRFHILKDLH